MGRGKQLTDRQKGQVDVLLETGLSVRKVAKTLQVSRHAVSNYRNKVNIEETPERRGRKRKLSPRSVSLVERVASNSEISSRRIVSDLALSVSKWTVLRRLWECPNLKFEKKACKPPLTARHREARINWSFGALHHLPDLEAWSLIVFSDEKKFNLDGPDGFAYYWHDLRKEKKTFMKRQSGGGSVMVWACFCRHGKSQIAFLEDNVNAEFYTMVLDNVLQPFLDFHNALPLRFQQDNAAVHTARIVKTYFQDENINTIDWPAKSPDLNPIENLWGILVRQVYKDNKQYINRQELKTAIVQAWDTIPQEVIDNLIESMPRRCTAVLDAQGGPTKY